MRIKPIRRMAWCIAVVAGISMLGCKEKNPNTPKVTAVPTTAAEIDPRSKVIGVEPAPPTGETSATAAAPGSRSEISKSQQSSAMPLPGQANDHSTLSPKATQKPKANTP